MRLTEMSGLIADGPHHWANFGLSSDISGLPWRVPGERETSWRNPDEPDASTAHDGLTDRQPA